MPAGILQFPLSSFRTLDSRYPRGEATMSELKGQRLVVNLGAAQARKRLKGFGHGVRKVQTGGTNRAVIIHTALGHNLEALKAKFADVGFECPAEDEPVEDEPGDD